MFAILYVERGEREGETERGMEGEKKRKGHG